jgi:hopanoid C-3 methylase
MRLLFVHPGPLLYTDAFLRREPVSLKLVTQAARRAGYSTRLINLQVESQADYHRISTEHSFMRCAWGDS